MTTEHDVQRAERLSRITGRRGRRAQDRLEDEMRDDLAEALRAAQTAVEIAHMDRIHLLALRMDQDRDAKRNLARVEAARRETIAREKAGDIGSIWVEWERENWWIYDPAMKTDVYLPGARIGRRAVLKIAGPNEQGKALHPWQQRYLREHDVYLRLLKNDGKEGLLWDLAPGASRHEWMREAEAQEKLAALVAERDARRKR